MISVLTPVFFSIHSNKNLYYSVPFHCLVECVNVVGTCLDDGDACVVTAVGKDEVDARELVAVGVPSNSRPKMI